MATPIGTARDITLRALDILASADVLAAEDTRSLRRLMDIHAVPLDGRRILSYHDHSGARDEARLMDALAGGASVAYAAEAGTPLIADPGFELSRKAAAAGHLVTAAPGPSALTTALCLAGLPTDAVLFAGFLPAARGARRTRLSDLSAVQATLVLYEAPHRLAAMLADAVAVLGGERQVVMARELTKRFEDVRRTTLADLHQQITDTAVKGEVVILVDRARQPSVQEADIEQALRDAMSDMSVRDAADLVSRAHDLPRRKVYQMALKLGKNT